MDLCTYRYLRLLNFLFLGEFKTGGPDLFKKMYNKQGSFTRGQFYKNPVPIEFKSGSYRIKGEMGTTHKGEIQIQIFNQPNSTKEN